MHIRFTKMQGAGNDFVVLDETRERLPLTPAHYRFLADRHLGVGADQILSVRPPPTTEVDFEYVIHNADGGEVEQCGNGARCFARYVRDKGLTHKDTIRVHTRAGAMVLHVAYDGRITVAMGAPQFTPEHVPFTTQGLQPRGYGAAQQWPLQLNEAAPFWLVPVSMGNPHAVQVADDVDAVDVATLGPLIEHHPRFPQRVNVGWMQIIHRKQIRLRVHERGAGETLACGSGACAAVAAGIRLDILDHEVDVQARGGRLTIAWNGQANDSLYLTGPATIVFEGQIDLPKIP